MDAGMTGPQLQINGKQGMLLSSINKKNKRPCLDLWLINSINHRSRFDTIGPYIASWVDLDRFYPFYSDQPLELQRTVDPISDSGEDDNCNPRRFHIRIQAPADAAAHIALIERIVEQEKPAYVSYELEFI